MTLSPVGIVSAGLSNNFRRLQFVSCAVANMEHVNPLVFLNNTKYDTINVRLVAVEEMAELRFLRVTAQRFGGSFRLRTASLSLRYHFRAATDSSALISLYKLAKSRPARAAMSTRYAILGFKLVKKLSGWSCTAVCYVVEPLANTFLSIGARDNVEQTLIGFGVLHDGGSFTINREHYRGLVRAVL